MKPEKIAEEVGQFYMTSDGKEVAFIKDIQETPENEYIYGELYYQKLGEEALKISSDVLEVRTTNTYSFLDGDKFLFMKYVDTDEYGVDIGNYMSYNGTDTEILAEDLYYKK